MLTLPKTDLGALLKSQHPSVDSPVIVRISADRSQDRSGIIVRHDTGYPYLQIVRLGDDSHLVRQLCHDEPPFVTEPDLRPARQHHTPAQSGSHGRQVRVHFAADPGTSYAGAIVRDSATAAGVLVRLDLGDGSSFVVCGTECSYGPLAASPVGIAGG